MRFAVAVAASLVALGGWAQVLDRVAAVAGKDVVTESEVLEEIRVTALLNGDRPAFTPESKRAAANRLVDQALIRHEIAASHYPAPNEKQVNDYIQQFVHKRFRSDADLRRALHDYGLTGNELRAHLAWQVAALQFTEARFGTGGDVDRQMDAWLKNARDQTKIEFKKEALP